MARILLGVTGSIAAYKAADLTSKLVQRGHEVHVVMTRSATELVRPRTFSAISRNPVHTDLWDPAENRLTEHISLAELPEVVVVAPATANTIGKIACGIADEILSTTLLAVTVPVLIAPAMNVHMYENPIVKANMDRLRGLGYVFVEPGEGYLACGDVGRGRMAEPVEIADAVEAARVMPVAAPSGPDTLILIGFLIVPILAVVMISWFYRRSREVLRRWLEREGLELVASERRYFARGPFFWTTPSGMDVYRVTVRWD